MPVPDLLRMGPPPLAKSPVHVGLPPPVTDRLTGLNESLETMPYSHELLTWPENHGVRARKRG